jgi:hypothetical protein
MSNILSEYLSSVVNDLMIPEFLESVDLSRGCPTFYIKTLKNAFLHKEKIDKWFFDLMLKSNMSESGEDNIPIFPLYRAVSIDRLNYIR